MNDSKPLPAEVQAVLDELHGMIQGRSGYGNIVITITSHNTYDIDLGGLNHRVVVRPDAIVKRW